MEGEEVCHVTRQLIGRKEFILYTTLGSPSETAQDPSRKFGVFSVYFYSQIWCGKCNNRPFRSLVNLEVGCRFAVFCWTKFYKKVYVALCCKVVTKTHECSRHTISLSQYLDVQCKEKNLWK